MLLKLNCVEIKRVDELLPIELLPFELNFAREIGKTGQLEELNEFAWGIRATDTFLVNLYHCLLVFFCKLLMESHRLDTLPATHSSLRSLIGDLLLAGSLTNGSVSV